MTARPSLFLALTSDSRFWDVSGPVLFLGRWCLTRENPSDRLPFPCTILESPWDEPASMDEVGRYLDRKTECWLEQIRGVLNAVHRVDYSMRDWWILAGGWLYHAIHQSYDRFLHLRKARQLDCALRTRIVASSAQLVPRVTRQLMDATENPSGHILLLSRVADAMGIPAESIHVDNLLNAARRLDKRAVPQRLANGLLRCLSRVRAMDAASGRLLFYGYAGTYRALLSLILLDKRIVYRPLRRAILPDPNPIDMPLRHALFGRIKVSDDFDHVFRHCLPHIFPASLVEDFPLWRARQAGFGRQKIRSVFTSFGLVFNEAFAFELVHLLHQGAQLFVGQHGGGYGTWRYCPCEQYEQKCADFYITWGWKEGARQIPLPSLRWGGKGSRTRPKAGVDMCILMGTDRPLLAHRIQNGPLSGQMYQYFAAQKAFYDALHPDVRHSFAYKPYPIDYHHEGSDWYARMEQPIRIEKRPMKKLLRGNHLYIWDHHGTGFLETLALNRPTIMFWDPMLWGTRAQAKDRLAVMERAGIYHVSPQAAAAHLNGIARNPWQWWSTESVQKARLMFATMYAGRHDAWRVPWKRMLHEIRDQAV